jgi:hypothetical protein
MSKGGLKALESPQNTDRRIYGTTAPSTRKRWSFAPIQKNINFFNLEQFNVSCTGFYPFLSTFDEQWFWAGFGLLLEIEVRRSTRQFDTWHDRYCFWQAEVSFARNDVVLVLLG